MAVIKFGDDSKLYHYPPPSVNAPKNQLTLCGLKKPKTLDVIMVSDAIPNDWDPCPECAAIDEHEKHFVGRVI